MKKNNYLFLACLTVGMTAFGQTSMLKKETHTSNSNRVIVEEYIYPYTITCVSTYNGPATFIHSSTSSSSTMEVVIKDIIVNDMVIFGDTLFFCGTNNNNSQGIMGFFDIHELFFNSGSVWIQNIFLVGNYMNYANTLTRLDSYIDNSHVRHVVSVGTCNENLPCLVDMFESNFGSWVYNAGYINDPDETLTDIKIVGPVEDRHAVTAGYYYGSEQCLCLRAYNINSLFMPGGTQDNRRIFMDTTANGHWIDDIVLITDVDMSHFATLSCHYDYDLVKSYYKNNICFFNRGDFVAGLPSSMVSMTDFDFLNSSINRRIEQFEMSRPSSTLHFLHTYSHLSDGAMSEFCEVPYSTPTALGANTTYRTTGSLLQGLSLFNYGLQYRLGGFTSSSPTEIEYWLKTTAQQTNCAERYSYRSKNLRNVKLIIEHVIFYNIGDICELEETEYGLYSHEFETICIEGTKGKEAAE